MREAKGVAEDESLAYEWVIVDEAARVGPRDLMIALEQGKRTILVGDHRQLPQLLDQEVAERLEQGDETGNGAEWLKKSMFEYLFAERLKSLEEQDKIVRRVTLDWQYRMHPMLGDFISRTFYESQDPDEGFESRAAASDFAHDLPGTDGRCAAWMDVRGRRTKSGTSSVNMAEAEAIAIEGRRVDGLRSRAGPDLRRHLVLPRPGRSHRAVCWRTGSTPSGCWSGRWTPSRVGSSTWFSSRSSGRPATSGSSSYRTD